MLMGHFTSPFGIDLAATFLFSLTGVRVDIGVSSRFKKDSGAILPDISVLCLPTSKGQFDELGRGTRAVAPQLPILRIAVTKDWEDEIRKILEAV